jgi:hypothetical protein
VRFEHALNKADLRDGANKAELARQILYIVAKRRPTQTKAAELHGQTSRRYRH